MTAFDVPFLDRREGGRALAERLHQYRGRHDLLVLALPRGGVPVAYEVAAALNAPLDVLVVRKLGFPGHEEYAMGAIASGGVRFMNPDITLMGLNVPDQAIEAVTAREQLELERRERLYRGERPAAPIAGHTVILVDDGLATGATMHAAALAVRQHQPAHLCIAVPVAARQSCADLRAVADQLVCVAMPEPFRAVGLWYRDFPQTSDEEVHQLLVEADRRQHEHATH